MTRTKRLIGGLALLVLLGLGSVGWLYRHPMLAWYYVHQLVRAEGDDRDQWVRRMADLDDAAVTPRLLACFRQGQARACANARYALGQRAQSWGGEDPRWAALFNQLAELFPGASSPGQQTILDLEVELLRPCPARAAAPNAAIRASARLLAEAAGRADSEVRNHALPLAAILITQSEKEDVSTACRRLAQGCMEDGDPDNRLGGVRLALYRSVNLLPPVVSLLNDASAQVRGAAIVALGNAPGVLATDDLLRWLHDPDDDVRRLCEAALRARGLEGNHLQLGRLITDARPQARLEVLDCLRQSTDLDPLVWLLRLSRDPVPAVRAAAVRAAMNYRLLDLSERMAEMARADPNPTVRQIVQFYLSQPDSHLRQASWEW